jgi:AraC-like DNA-binding protein
LAVEEGWRIGGAALLLQTRETEPNVLVDLCLAWILSIGRRGTDGQITPFRLELTRPAEHRELLETHFGCRVRFKARRNALVFRNNDLDRPFVTHNVELLAAIGAQLESELQEKKAGADVGEQVKHTLKRSLAGKRPTLPHVAQELGMSPRTLQRRLTDADITFQRVVEDTRRELAHHYLKQAPSN